MEFRSHTLDNGLEIVAETNPNAYTVGMGFFVKTGSRDETADISGVSHFLEHMMFKGTARRTAEDVNREFDEMGAHYNAFTSEESTVYYAAVLPEFARQTIELWSDILRPALREEDFETEKQVILEEIQMYEDQPPYCADDKCKALYFGRHPLAPSVLGSSESVTALRADDMRSYFEARYSPANIVLAATGKIDFDELVKLAEDCCGSWQRHDAPRTLVEAHGESHFETLEKSAAVQEYVVQLAGAPGSSDESRYAAKVLCTILGDDTGSRLYWELVDPGLAESVSIGHHDYLDCGLYMTYLVCDPQQTEANLARILDVYRRAEQEGFNEAELQQAKSKINSRLVLSSERPRGRLFTVGGNWLQRGEYRSLQTDLATVDALTVDDLQRVLKDYPLSTSTTVAIGPLAAVTQPK